MSVGMAVVYPGHVDIHTGKPLPVMKMKKTGKREENGEEIPLFGRSGCRCRRNDAFSNKRAYIRCLGRKVCHSRTAKGSRKHFDS